MLKKALLSTRVRENYGIKKKSSSYYHFCPARVRGALAGCFNPEPQSPEVFIGVFVEAIAVGSIYNPNHLRTGVNSMSFSL